MLRVFGPLLYLILGFSALQVPGLSLALAAPIQNQLDAPRDKASIATDLFSAVTLDYDQEQVASYMREALTVSRRACDRVSDYQVYLQQPNRLVLKVKCPGRPIFGLTVANNGFLSVYGGDGIIASFAVTDGPVVTLRDPAATAAETAQRDTAAAAGEIPGEEQPALPQNEPAVAPWIIASIAVNVFMIGALVIAAFFIWKWVKTKQTETQTITERSKFSSSDKDTFLNESEEILPDIFQHPDGLYIARGRHGKRRVFPILITAILYRDYGVKFLEIR